jgi:hypothetical protein
LNCVFIFPGDLDDCGDYGFGRGVFNCVGIGVFFGVNIRYSGCGDSDRCDV